jgi:Protein of unknown function (DUF2721)
MDPTSLTHGIQLAIAPVFLLTAVAAMISALATRLGRIIDRARVVEERLEAKTAINVDAAYQEIESLKVRGRLVNVAVLLLTLCGMLIGLTVMELFLSEVSAIPSERWVPVSFMAGVVGFNLALLCFLAESVLATRVLRFGRHLPPRA